MTFRNVSSSRSRTESFFATNMAPQKAQRPQSGETPVKTKVFSVTFTRSNKDVEDNWKETDGYGFNDLDDFANAAIQAKLTS